MTLNDNIMMFVSNIRAVFRVLFPCHDTNENCDAGIAPALDESDMISLKNHTHV